MAWWVHGAVSARNEGWSGREGQPPESLVTKEPFEPTDMGVTGGACAWFRLVFALGSDLAQPVLGQRDRIVPDSPIGMGGSSASLPPPPQCPEFGDLGGDAASRVE